MTTLTTHQLDLIEKIRALKAKKRALVLVHNYLRPEVYEVADYIGDSLGLCEKAAETDCDMVVFSAVHFMAESAALLLPTKKVLLPDYDAGCALSDMITGEQVREFRSRYPEAGVVCYINSTAEVKAESDVVCTSSNAVEVTRELPYDQILFVPDKNLAAFVAKQVPEKEIIPWNGYCPIHHRISREQVLRAKADHPGAKVIAHPECPEDVLMIADEVASTSGMVSYAEKSPEREFIVLTECGLTQRMMRDMPGKKFMSVCNLCYDMKKTTLDSVYEALMNEQYEIRIPESVAVRARESFRKMFALTSVPVTLPCLTSLASQHG